MRRRWLLIMLTVLIVGIGAVVLLTLVAPESSPIRLLQEDAVGCLTDEAGDCLVLPAVSGATLTDNPITFPDDFSAPYTLVVVPFDQEQQEAAAEWLEPFQSIAEEYEALSYINIAALPDLQPLVRTMVVGGLLLGVREEATQERIVLLFLEDQAAFLQALGLPDDTVMQVLVVDDTGAIYWRGSGVYSAETEAELRTFIAELIG